ncbi:MAG TPA: NUDIX domain-containing protein [bacterium]|nr:NUDIX domain-containing protein [bacterium]
MAQKQHVALIFCKLADQNNDIEVLLSKRAALQYEDPNSPKPQSFFQGMQIFPGGKMEETDKNVWYAIARELREEAGTKAYNWVRIFLKKYPEKIHQVGEFCFAIEMSDDESEEFFGKIKLIQDHESVDWYTSKEVEQFEDLKPFKNGVPDGINAIFQDEAEWIKTLAEKVLKKT